MRSIMVRHTEHVKSHQESLALGVGNRITQQAPKFPISKTEQISDIQGSDSYFPLLHYHLKPIATRGGPLRTEERQEG